MKEYTILDKNTDNDGNLESFLIVWEGGEPELKNGSAENRLLFIDELYEFIGGDKGVILSEEPFVAVQPSEQERTYLLTVNDTTLTSYPDTSQEILEGVKDVIDGNGLDRILSLHEELMQSQVRRGLVKSLVTTFPESEQERIDVYSNGWLIDDMYLVTWEAKIYQHNDDEEHYEVGMSGVVGVDTRHELVETTIHESESIFDSVEITIDGVSYNLTSIESSFLTRVKWLLNREEYHNDVPFWLHADSVAKKENQKT